MCMWNELFCKQLQKDLNDNNFLFAVGFFLVQTKYVIGNEEEKTSMSKSARKHRRYIEHISCIYLVHLAHILKDVLKIEE